MMVPKNVKQLCSEGIETLTRLAESNAINEMAFIEMSNIMKLIHHADESHYGSHNEAQVLSIQRDFALTWAEDNIELLASVSTDVWGHPSFFKALLDRIDIDPMNQAEVFDLFELYFSVCIEAFSFQEAALILLKAYPPFHGAFYKYFFEGASNYPILYRGQYFTDQLDEILEVAPSLRVHFDSLPSKEQYDRRCKKRSRMQEMSERNYENLAMESRASGFSEYLERVLHFPYSPATRRLVNSATVNRARHCYVNDMLLCIDWASEPLPIRRSMRNVPQ